LGPDPEVVKERKREPGFWDLLYGGMNLVEKISEIEQSGPALKYLYK
jgi:hypothetical protein